jgi:hypothetical protein
MKTKKISGQYRQGDILIEAIDQVPDQALKQMRGEPIILAYGEVTGHDHRLIADKADWWKLGDEQFIEPAAPATIRHQEHGPISIEERPHRVIRQREYSPEAIRNVAD